MIIEEKILKGTSRYVDTDTGGQSPPPTDPVGVIK